MLITQYLKTYFESQVVKQYGWDMDEVNGGGQVIPKKQQFSLIFIFLTSVKNSDSDSDNESTLNPKNFSVCVGAKQIF